MGSSAWSDDHYAARASLRAATGKSAFAYHADIAAGKTAAKVHAKMDPKGARMRESRDSDAHPESHAVAVLFDVTGSMGEVPKILQANLPKLMGLLIRKGYLEHPQIMIGAIGDATCDRSPLQVGQFESGIEIEDDLGKIHIEGGGGGQKTESYELAMHFLAHHTSMDCFEKRGKRGYCFIIGDELPYPKAKRAEVASVIGDAIPADIATKDVVAELSRTFDVYYVLPKMTSYWDDPAIHRTWSGLVGQRFLRLEDPSAICELIASTIGLAEGATDMDGVEDDLRDAGTSGKAIGSVSRALATLGGTAPGKGVVASVPGSGKASGLATF